MLIRSEVEPIRSSISIKKVKFTGGLKFDENGTTYRAVDPGKTQYVGEPSPQLDHAWRSLIRGISLHICTSYFCYILWRSPSANRAEGQGVDLRGDEAAPVADLTYQKPGGWYLTGADAFHQLHCLVSSLMLVLPLSFHETDYNR